ncbi:class I SAM-dependent methyltransferase [Candidatus Poribacteria bacterium]|nr:class I SAM-dependent methyltransferase [Candidatus Poribacteria bacterium]
MNIKIRIPWQVKIAAKLVLSHIPVNYNIWRKLSIFKHGEMYNPSYAFNVFKSHFDNFDKNKKKFVALELGPGDSLFSALIAYTFGAKHTYMIDAGDFAQKDLDIYKVMIEFLRENVLSVSEIKNFDSLENLMEICGGQYLTNGLASLRSIPDQSVDYIWSHTVLQHIRHKDFFETLCQLRRIIRPDGISSHTIDLMDMMDKSLNSLRFPRDIWETNFIANSGFYTNRIRYSEMLELFIKAGFNINGVNIKRWDKLPISIKKLSPEFKNLSEDELRIFGFDVILKPA